MRWVIFGWAVMLAGQSMQEKILAAVNADADESLKLLEQMVNINSGTLNPAGVKKVAEVLRPRMRPFFRNPVSSGARTAPGSPSSRVT